MLKRGGMGWGGF